MGKFMHKSQVYDDAIRAIYENRLDDARDKLNYVCLLWPLFAEAWHNLGLVYIKQEQWEEAFSALVHVINLQPNNAESRILFARACAELGGVARAAEHARHAVALKPDSFEYHWKAFVYEFLCENFDAAWPHEDFWRAHRERPKFSQPVWDGSPLDGRTILLYPDGGFGDQMFYIRYARELKKRGAGRVLAGCYPQLFDLLNNTGGLGVDQWLRSDKDLPEFDTHCYVSDLFGLFRADPTRTAEMQHFPYLHVDSLLSSRWKCRIYQELPSPDCLKVGILWKGSDLHKRDSQRSVPLAAFEPLSRIPGAKLFSLQVGRGADQLRQIDFPVVDLAKEFDPNSFSDAAAAIKNLDLVISVCSAVAHLAGALAVPVWLVASHLAHWLWLTDRPDSPWYPTLKIFRQPRPSDWAGIMERVANELATVAASGSGPS